MASSYDNDSDSGESKSAEKNNSEIVREATRSDRERNRVTVVVARNNSVGEDLKRRQKEAYVSGKRRKIFVGEENQIKDCVRKHIISKAKFLDGEGLEPSILRIRFEREGGVPPIGETHDYPDLTAKKGMYHTILEQLQLHNRSIEKKVAFWMTWSKTIGNYFKQHRNAVTSKMKSAIIKGM